MPSFLSKIIKDRANIYFLGVALILTSTLELPIPIPVVVFYSLGFVLVFSELVYKCYKNQADIFYNNYAFFLFLTLALSCAVNGIFNYRAFLLLCFVFFFGSCVSSPSCFRFKVLIINYFCEACLLVTIINFCCYITGFNGFRPPDNPLEFKGITFISMWLSPIASISAIYSLVKLLNAITFRWRLYFFLNVVCSVFVCVAAGSRSATIAMLAASTCVVFFKTKNIKRFIIASLVSAIVLCALFPFLDTQRMESKQETQEELGRNSRANLWESRFAEIEQSPFLGVGLSVSLQDGNKLSEGRNESGSGWLSVASQTGLISLLLFCICLLNVLTTKKKHISTSPSLILTFSILIFICLHSVAEGYFLTAGYWLCMFFWLCLGCLTDAKRIPQAVQSLNLD